MSKIKEFIDKLKTIDHPIEVLDEISIAKVGTHKLTWGFKASRYRFIAVVVAVVSTIAMATQGFDSTIHFWSKDVPMISAIFGHTEHFGAGMHWSTVATYMMAFFFISLWLEKDNKILGFRNFAFTCSAILFTLGAFEITWSTLYDIIHFQSWTIWTFGIDQVTGGVPVFYRNLLWVFCLPLSYLIIRWTTEYKPVFNVNKTFFVLFIIMVASWLFWIFYPLPHVVYAGFGNVGSPLYPQTVYSLYVPYENDPTKLTMGAFYIPNDAVHAVNVLVKLIVTITFVYFYKIKLIRKDGFNPDKGEFDEKHKV